MSSCTKDHTKVYNSNQYHW